MTNNLVKIMNMFVKIMNTLVNMMNTLVNMMNTLVNMMNTFVNMTNTFVNMTNTFVNMTNTFVNMTNTFVNMMNTFVNMTNTFVNIMNTFVNMTNLVLIREPRYLSFWRSKVFQWKNLYTTEYFLNWLWCVHVWRTIGYVYQAWFPRNWMADATHRSYFQLRCLVTVVVGKRRQALVTVF
jgi:hypothetical protein